LPAQSPAPVTPPTISAAKPGEKEQHSELVPFMYQAKG
jgi:hypothetical protein